MCIWCGKNFDFVPCSCQFISVICLLYRLPPWNDRVPDFVFSNIQSWDKVFVCFAKHGRAEISRTHVQRFFLSSVTFTTIPESGRNRTKKARAVSCRVMCVARRWRQLTAVWKMRTPHRENLPWLAAWLPRPEHGWKMYLQHLCMYNSLSHLVFDRHYKSVGEL